jgi:3'-5' exoribonuclease
VKRLDLTTLVQDTALSGVACVSARTERTTRGGKPYLDVTLRNATGSQPVKVWSDAMPAWAHISVGDALQIGGVVESGWKGLPEFRVQLVERLSDDHPVRAEMNAISPEPVEQLELRLEAVLDAIERPEARRIVDAVLEVHGTAFRSAPAAVGHHHNWIHGLLCHQVEVAESCLHLSQTTLVAPLVDRSLLLVAALVHDIGKLETYEWEGTPIAVSATGLGRSHITVGLEMVRRITDPLAERGEISRADVDHLCHCIEAHHGRPEWGSPTEPASVEAHVLHLADLASARIRPLVDRAATDPAGDPWVRPSGWGERAFYVHRRALAGEARVREGTVADRASATPRPAGDQEVPTRTDDDAAKEVFLDPDAPVRRELISAVRGHLARAKWTSQAVSRSAVDELLRQLTSTTLGEAVVLTPALCGYLVVVLGRHVRTSAAGMDAEVLEELRGLIVFLEDHTPAWMLKAIHEKRTRAA